MATATLAIVPLVYPLWKRFGVSVEQYVEVQCAEEDLAQYPAIDVVEEAHLRLFGRDLPEIPDERLREIVMGCRRMRQATERHVAACPGCPECTELKAES